MRVAAERAGGTPTLRVARDAAVDPLMAAVGDALDQRLIARDPAPVAVALSGGGDSLALLLAAKVWADRRGRALLALSVDHRLRPEGADWARWCAARAGRLGVRHQTLVWGEERPAPGLGTPGLAASARRARHRLLADAARAAGAGVILMGHTADDRAEARLMRAAGASVPSPRTWSPSPVWPEGRDLFLLRPLLGLRRAAPRAALVALGETWIEDPANDNPASARAQARARLAGGPLDEDGGASAGAAASDLFGLIREDARPGPAGDLTLPLAALDLGHGTGEGARAGAILAAALLCAAGSERPPRRERIDRLLARLRTGDGFAATLAGARVTSDGAHVHLVRDAADSRRGAPADIALPPETDVVWDGRFEVRAHLAGARLRTLAGRAGRLPASWRRAVRAVRPAARGALPLIVHGDGAMACPTLVAAPRGHEGAKIAIRPLAGARLAGALGGIVDEAAARRMAKPDGAP